jgi:hypothetical protein
MVRYDIVVGRGGRVVGEIEVEGREMAMGDGGTSKAG